VYTIAKAKSFGCVHELVLVE
jgi:hypothetical protein